MSANSTKAFRELRELIRIVSFLGPKEKRGLSLDALRKSSRPIAKLYHDLQSDLNESETDAYKRFSLTLDRAAEAEPELTLLKKSHGPRFNRLKSRLKSQLLHTIFLLDLGMAGYSEYSQMLFRINRKVFLARVLRVLNARELSASLAKKGLPQAMKIEEWSCAMEFLVILRANASQTGNMRSHRFYSNEYILCQRLLAAEQEAELIIERVQLAVAASSGEKPELAELAERGAERIGELAKAYTSFKLHFLELRLLGIAAQMSMNYPSALSVCERAFMLLDFYPQFSNRARRAEYAITMLVSATQLLDHENATKAIDACNLNLKPNENNWFTFKEYEFLYLMRSLRFTEARSIANELIAHERFDAMTEAVQDKWRLFQLYSEYATGSSVSLKADLNTIAANFTADKRGFNAAIIILHILVLAQRRQFSELRDRMDFLREYKKRYLKGPQNSQIAHFFGMLGMIETCDLNYRKVVARSSKKVVELQRIESSEAIQGEVILPYSYMWGQILEALQDYHLLSYRT